MTTPENPESGVPSQEIPSSVPEESTESREDRVERDVEAETTKLGEGLEKMQAELAEVGGTEGVGQVLEGMTNDRKAASNERMAALEKRLLHNRDMLGYGLELLNPLAGIGMAAGAEYGERWLTMAAHALTYGTGIAPIAGAGMTLYGSAGWVKNKIQLKSAERKAKRA